ncbi:MAG: iron-sulfur cluster assembly scaffold protein [Patescibacteria group bacterium]|nr:MAG: iron-sulfur cluster assembly scaffold protein [Patescibacteria group bacterium]
MYDMYHEDLLDEAKNPNNYGDLVGADVTTTQFNASCGDVITVAIKLSADKTKIEEVKWKGHGCIISQAAMSVLSEKIKGYDTSKLQELTKEQILEELGLPQISMGRVKCLLLGLSAVKKIL